MTSNSTDDRCASGDNLCVVRVYEQEVIIVPVLLLLASAATLLAVCLLRGCPSRRGPAPKRDPPQPSLRSSRRPDRGRDLRGIDAPEELNVMEHEVIQMPLHPVQEAPPLHPVQEAPPLRASDHVYTFISPVATGGSEPLPLLTTTRSDPPQD
ncbi:unnamed protein product [Arctogadus glacialis]